jgi:DNA polymerase elongation subunit (family B)
MFGDPLEKIQCKSSYDKKKKVEYFRSIGTRTFESDFRPMDRILTDKYYQCKIPPLNVILFDIEVDYRAAPPALLELYNPDGTSKDGSLPAINPDELRYGFPHPEAAYAPINAITIYRKWEDKYYCVFVPSNPDEEDLYERTKAKIAEVSPDCDVELIFVDDEAALIELTLDLIDESDLISGWNSETFDIPTCVKRTLKVLGSRAASRWTFDGAPEIEFDTFETFGRKQTVCRMTGRVHLDYMDLFKKFTFEGRSSYSLDSVGIDVADMPKLHYEGTLEDLYVKDQATFAAYSVRDVEVLVKIDKIKKFIDLANTYSHTNTCQMSAVLGTVKMTDSAINNFSIHELGLRVFDKLEENSGATVEGAVVLTPRVGLHKNVGSVDINSLYPSTYRCINISPEMYIGQFSNYHDDWVGIISEDDKNHILCLDDGSYAEYDGKTWKQILRSAKWAISPYGTVFDQSRGPGIIPQLLAKWYAERKSNQAEKKQWSAVADSILID